MSYYEKKVKDGVKRKPSVYTDGSGLMLVLHEFETLDDFNKVWGDEEYQAALSVRSYTLDNCKIKIWRPPTIIPQK